MARALPRGRKSQRGRQGQKPPLSSGGACHQSRIEGGTPELWDNENDYAIVDPDINKRLGRIYLEMILGEPKWLWFLQTEPAPLPNSGKADTLDEAKTQFKQRYLQVRAGRDRLAPQVEIFLQFRTQRCSATDQCRPGPQYGRLFSSHFPSEW
jgi:hypothetical protein